ncbi:PAAR domain-containing protein [Rhizobium sp. AC27/96]|uniref:PAAR domain-containing protein n=1 Tax=Rhizobium sp. AC27/96 TaxID=1841653 RepID=UPI0009F4FB9D|nr:PAAR domain-containing protein [Rhizobium sp. AC27/96]
MANPVARFGDTSSHGGSITSSASKTGVEGKLVARVGDTLSCPIHGPNPILTGSPKFTAEGAQVARSGSVTACGAVIVGGATKTLCE